MLFKEGWYCYDKLFSIFKMSSYSLYNILEEIAEREIKRDPKNYILSESILGQKI